MTIKETKDRIDDLVSDYVQTYTGKQPIYSVIDDNYIKVKSEFLNHLPSDVASLVTEAVNKLKES